MPSANSCRALPAADDTEDGDDLKGLADAPSVLKVMECEESLTWQDAARLILFSGSVQQVIQAVADGQLVLTAGVRWPGTSGSPGMPRLLGADVAAPVLDLLGIADPRCSCQDMARLILSAGSVHRVKEVARSGRLRLLPGAWWRDPMETGLDLSATLWHGNAGAARRHLPLAMARPQPRPNAAMRPQASPPALCRVRPRSPDGRAQQANKRPRVAAGARGQGAGVSVGAAGSASARSGSGDGAVDNRRPCSMDGSAASAAGSASARSGSGDGAVDNRRPCSMDGSAASAAGSASACGSNGLRRRSGHGGVGKAQAPGDAGDNRSADAGGNEASSSSGGGGGGGNLHPPHNLWHAAEQASLRLHVDESKLPKEFGRRLLHYQQQTVTWMVEKEDALLRHTASLPHGGIIATETGMGKKVMAAALIVAQRQRLGDRPPGEYRGTLVLSRDDARDPLLEKWKTEVWRPNLMASQKTVVGGGQVEFRAGRRVERLTMQCTQTTETELQKRAETCETLWGKWGRLHRLIRGAVGSCNCNPVKTQCSTAPAAFKLYRDVSSPHFRECSEFTFFLFFRR